MGVNLGRLTCHAARSSCAGLERRSDAPGAPIVSARTGRRSARTGTPRDLAQLIDLGSLLDGDDVLAGTARPPWCGLSKERAQEIGVADGDAVTVGTDRGAITLPRSITDMPDEVVWLPTNFTRLDRAPRARSRPRLSPSAGGQAVIPTLADFGHDPLVDRPAQVVGVLFSSVVMTLFTIWYERRVVARMQVRPGPTGTGRSACCSRWPTV
jgi:NADH-quinone oxidoreductase subunit G